jgi:hypothetical protein
VPISHYILFVLPFILDRKLRGGSGGSKMIGGLKSELTGGIIKLNDALE